MTCNKASICFYILKVITWWTGEDVQLTLLSIVFRLNALVFSSLASNVQAL